MLHLYLPMKTLENLPCDFLVVSLFSKGNVTSETNAEAATGGVL